MTLLQEKITGDTAYRFSIYPPCGEDKKVRVAVRINGKEQTFIMPNKRPTQRFINKVVDTKFFSDIISEAVLEYSQFHWDRLKSNQALLLGNEESLLFGESYDSRNNRHHTTRRRRREENSRSGQD
jgi:hypothetical protein